MADTAAEVRQAARVRPALELVLRESPRYTRASASIARGRETGLALIDLGRPDVGA